MGEYTDEEIKQLHNKLIEHLDEEIETRPADGHIPGHKLFEAVDDAFEDSPIDHPRQ